MTDAPLRGYRIVADVLLDTSNLHVDGRHLREAERAACLVLDILKAADVNLCGTLHVSRLQRKVNAQTGELYWKAVGLPEASIQP